MLSRLLNKDRGGKYLIREGKILLLDVDYNI